MNKESIQYYLISLFVTVLVLIGIRELELNAINDFGRAELRNEKLSVDSNVSNSRITYSRFMEYLDLGLVKQVDLYQESRSAIVQIVSPTLGDRPMAVRVEIPVGGSQIINKLKDYGINFDSHPPAQKGAFLNFLTNLAVPVFFIWGLFLLLQNSDEFSTPGNPPMNLGKSPARFNPRPDTGITFDDIAGIDEAKAEFQEIVSFLKEPERYTRVGARIPKGALLVGPPGTGKTLLAKAIATEAKVPFFSVAGSEFVEMFIGIGAARIRDLFNKAADNAPCIVFIDEIDAVGRERGSGIGGGNDEREQTLNQLLTEMDGFKENKGVIVVGATNRVDILDAALLRPGRFDRQIAVGLPDLDGRTEILKVHAKDKKLEKDISLFKLAGRTPGFSGADLANFLNEAAILTTRHQKKIITKEEVGEAIDRIVIGIAGNDMEETVDKRLIAYHEVGHALTGSLLKYHDPVEKITITPRGNAKGLTWFTSTEDQNLVTRTQLLDRIIMILSGRVVEQIIFGKPEITTGASNDLQQATNIARQMVTQYGMSSLGPIALENGENGNGIDCDDELSNRVDDEICKIVKHCEKLAYQIISENRIIINLIVEELINLNTLEGDKFIGVVKNFTLIPKKLVNINN